jgi:hypothetical protein
LAGQSEMLCAVKPVRNIVRIASPMVIYLLST